MMILPGSMQAVYFFSFLCKALVTDDCDTLKKSHYYYTTLYYVGRLHVVYG